MEKSVTILVNSCDSYEDTWYPMFKLLNIIQTFLSDLYTL